MPLWHREIRRWSWTAGQTSVTTVGADGHAGQSLRAGEGATTLAADPAGRVLVADTRGGQLLVFGVDPLILRQAYPVRQSPYGLAGSRRLAWVSQTAANIVIGYDLSTGIPVEKVRYPTVQQPNTLAFDDAADTLYVVSGSGGGVQVIEHAAGTHVDGGAAGPAAGGLGHRYVRRVRVGAVAPAAGGDQGQRVHPAVHRSGVPRLGADPGAALHRRQQASVVAPQEVSPGEPAGPTSREL